MLGQDKDWIPKENQETFRKNIKVTFFKQRVDDFRASQNSFEDWRCADKSITKEKIMGTTSALSH